MTFDPDRWRHTIFETLRQIDPRALFDVGLTEMDFRAVGDASPEEFPAAELVDHVDTWLAGLDPDGGTETNEWVGGGVRLLFRAKGRSPDRRGARGWPSFNQLEPVIGPLHLLTGEERRFVDLTLAEVEALADGTLRVVGQGASYQDTFQGIGDEMRHFGLDTVLELHPTEVTTYAVMLGLAEPLTSTGNYDATWREINRLPPND